MSPHEHWEQLAAAYALDALEPEERAEFVAHLDNCRECRELVDGHALVAAQLGALAVDEAGAAPSWSAIRDGVIGTPAAAPAPAGNVVALRHRRRFALLTAAAALVAVIAGVTAWQVSDGGSGGADWRTSASACQHTTGCHVVALRADGKTLGAVLTYGRAASIDAPDMPAPPAGSTWALWQIPRIGSPRLMAEFAEGDGVQGVLDMSYDDTSSFAVSREPVGATPTRPSAVVASGAVSA